MAAVARVAPRGALPEPGFDGIARFYQAMEYLSFGRMLERCRFHHIPALAECRRALVIGDGDGRFLARLLAAAPNLSADAVDASGAMLQLLRARVIQVGAADRIRTFRSDARCFDPLPAPYDLVATHFFLDCLAEQEADDLIARVRPSLAAGGKWLVSEFQIPAGGRLREALARGVIAALYAAFRILTGLKIRRIPPWRTLLDHHGFQPTASHSWLGGLVVSELWELRRATTLLLELSQQK